MKCSFCTANKLKIYNNCDSHKLKTKIFKKNNWTDIKNELQIYKKTSLFNLDGKSSRYRDDEDDSCCSTCSSSSSSDEAEAYQLPPRRAYGGVRAAYVPNDAVACARRRGPGSSNNSTISTAVCHTARDTEKCVVSWLKLAEVGMNCYQYYCHYLIIIDPSYLLVELLLSLFVKYFMYIIDIKCITVSYKIF